MSEHKTIDEWIKENLKPCPFCGNQVNIMEINTGTCGVTSLKIECSCGVDVSIESDETYSSWDGCKFRPGRDAIEKWNRRASDV